MSRTRGYVYLLSNPAMPQLVKIGKTRRHPAERTDELSAATGVPAPFQLAYFVEVGDCDAAEKWVHAELASTGKRESVRREFFRCELHEAIELLVRCRTLYAISRSLAIDSSDSAALESESDSDAARATGEELYELALEAFSGTWTTRPDEQKARYYLRLAAQQGHKESVLKHVEMLPNVDRFHPAAREVVDWHKKAFGLGRLESGWVIGDLMIDRPEDRELWHARVFYQIWKNFDQWNNDLDQRRAMAALICKRVHEVARLDGHSLGPVEIHDPEVVDRCEQIRDFLAGFLNGLDRGDPLHGEIQSAILDLKGVR